MSQKEFKVGQIIKNSLNQYTKIISHNRGVYGLSGWTNQKSAEKATVAVKYVNKYGLQYANAMVVSGKGKGKSESNAPDTDNASNSDAPTKASIAKLSADEAKDLLKKETGDEVETGKEAKERLVTHFGL